MVTDEESKKYKLLLFGMKQDITINPDDIKSIVRHYHQQLCWI